MYNFSALAANRIDRKIAELDIPEEVTVSRWNAAFLTFASAMSPDGIADEACEVFVSSAVHAAFDHTEYLAAVFLDYLGGAQHLTIEVTQSVDRSARDCIAETIIHQENQDDILLMWRVIRDNGALHIVDVATKQGGNTLWGPIELRAQFVELLDRNGGEVDALIAELNARQSRH